jgi:hypothetical protein
MPVAAEKPVRNSPGTEKKTGKKLYAPMATAEKRTTEKNGERGAPSDSRAIPAKATGAAMWYRRSSVRSEWRDTRIIAIRPRRLGIITTNPITVLDCWPNADFKICGSQKLNV